MNTLWLVTNRTCSLACPFCYQAQGDHSLGLIKAQGNLAYMSKSVADRALTWALDWAPADGVRCVMYGGEPLLSFDLIRAVVPEWKAAFKEAGKPVQFSVTTNGLHLRPEVRAFMDAENIGMLLSLDGPPEVHNRSRITPSGGPSWDIINPEDVLKWRPDLEIAWTLTPKDPWVPDHIDWLLDRGFKRQNYNVDFLSEWDVNDSARLEAFGRRVGRRLAEGKLLSNWAAKYQKAGTGKRMIAPCGLATGMLAVTPEGDVYPSQEMAFTVYEPGRAPGTPEYYKVGNVGEAPVLDPLAMARVSILKVTDMKPPAPYDCNDCIAQASCIGGCHCRYVGQDGVDPAHRMDVAPGLCPSSRAMMAGVIHGHWIEKELSPPAPEKPAARPCAPEPLTKTQTETPDPFQDVAKLTF